MPTYSLVLIPKTRAALRLAEHELGWMEQKPAWGPGRDDAFNLPKFILTQTPWDDTRREHGFPRFMAAAQPRGRPAAFGRRGEKPLRRCRDLGDRHRSLPTGEFEPRNEWLELFIAKLEPPPFPGTIDAELARSGERVFAGSCAGCHAENGARTGTAIPLAEIGTDPEHVLAWRQPNADRMNAVVRAARRGQRRYPGRAGRLCRPAAGRGVAARPVSAQWLGPDTVGPAVTAGAASPALLSRL